MSVRHGLGAPGQASFSQRAQVATIQSAERGVRDYILVRACSAPKINSLAPLPPDTVRPHLHALEWAARPKTILVDVQPTATRMDHFHQQTLPAVDGRAGVLS